jgi:hypothetical protein
VTSRFFSGEHLPECEDRKKCKGCSPHKIAMKGFPRKCAETGKDVRTLENLNRLRAGETVAFKRLCKVRSLAREGFSQGPTLHAVTKSFKSAYDKRTMLADGTTVPLVLGGGWEQKSSLPESSSEVPELEKEVAE